MKEFNLTDEVQNMANGTFQIVPFGNVPFPSIPFECSWAKKFCAHDLVDMKDSMHSLARYEDSGA